MKIIIEANPKEIADLVSQLQNQPNVSKKTFVPESSEGIVCGEITHCGRELE